MIDVAVLIPVLSRPERAMPLLESLAATTPSALPVFLCSPGDDAEIAAANDACLRVPIRGAAVAIMDWYSGPGDYARKINWGAVNIAADWFFLGADDLSFHPGWLEAALNVHAETGACVVGTNDLGNPRVTSGRHATHSLVHADYRECGTIDEPWKLLHDGYRHNWCNPPDAPIWMADCTFKPLGYVEVGDRVVGWERIEAEAAIVGTPRRALCEAEVLNVARRSAPLVHVRMESDREFICTPDHLWLNAAWSPSSPTAAQFVQPTVGRSLLHIAEPPTPIAAKDQRLAGWIAGMYDGEGSGIYIATQSTKHNPRIVEAIGQALTELRVPHTFMIRGSGVAEFVMTGGRQGYLDFLLRFEPVRRDALAAHILGWRTRESSRRERTAFGARRFGHRDRIVSVEPLSGEHEVISLTTTSGNYVAWGYASKNCDDEFVETARSRGTFAMALGSHVEHLHPNWGKAEDDATYAKGLATFHADSAYHRTRQHLWGG